MPRSRRDDDYDDDDYDDDYEDRRPPRRKPPKKFKRKNDGVPPGVLIGGGLFVGVVVIGLVIFLAMKTSKKTDAAGGATNTGFVPNTNTNTANNNAPAPAANNNPAPAAAPAPAPATILFNLSNLRRGVSDPFRKPILSVDFEYLGEGKLSGHSYKMCTKLSSGQVSRVALGFNIGNRDTMVIENMFGGGFNNPFAGKLEVWFEDSTSGKRVSEILTLN